MAVLTQLRVLIGRVELDRELAAGTPEHTSPVLARRAEVLRRWRVQQHLADSLERVIAEAVAPTHEHGASVPVQRDEVLLAQRDLLRLVQALRSDRPAPVRGVAAVSALLTDGAGPLFAPHPSGTLREAAFQAAFHAEAD
ncbi:MAG TPA: hypothetical protein VFX51_03135 [Solirubrobacteraceae bacterium]|nr:hypothetical protein [Solirubrobacteraceae bacterium]